MNRAPPKPAAPATRRAQLKYKPKIRSPLKDLNAGVHIKTRSGTCSSSSSSSTEPTAGCSRFRSSKSNSSPSSRSCKNPTNYHRQQLRSDCNSGNPKNATTTKPMLKSCKRLGQGSKFRSGSTDSAAERVQEIIRLPGCQTISQKKVVPACSDGIVWNRSRSAKLEEAAGKSGKDFEFTPLGCKTDSLQFVICNALGSNGCDKNDDNDSGNTPPPEATVSPEIQCGSTMMSVATPVCFGTGHVSGVSDKRKCRPRGILVVGGNCEGIDGLSISNEKLDGIGGVDNGCALVPPFPAEASVHWLLSPCDKDVERDGDSELLTSVHLQSSLPGSSGYQEVVSWLDEKIYSNLDGENSQGSKDTLGSENLIQTPESYSSLERHMSLPWIYTHEGKHAVMPNPDYAVDDQHRASVSSESQILVSEMESSFEFGCHLKPASSMEFSQLQCNWDKSSWIPDATVENEQQSQFRISWRDGLSSHHIEMDNSDCCRILSDEEDKNVQYSLYPATLEPKLPVPEISTASFIKKIDVKTARCMNRNGNSILQKHIQCAESISLDGVSLASSGESGWDMCYKDNLSQVE